MKLVEVMEMSITLIHRCMHMFKLFKFYILKMCSILYII